MNQADQVPLAVVGMGCRLPGADGLAAYWRLMIEGRSALAEFPPHRLDASLYYDSREGVRGKTYCRIGGVCDYRTTDPGCPLSSELLPQTDLAHVTGCQVAADACRHAGWDPQRLPTRKVGVFIGHTRGSELGGDLIYSAMIGQTAHWLQDVPEFAKLRDAKSIVQTLIEQSRGRLPRRLPGGVPDASSHLAAALIARSLGLAGPAIVLNAACSSSLLALAIARRQLARGEIEAAIVGGTTYCKWDNLILYSQARSCSARGSRPFDADADGLIASDGYAILVVKTLEQAVADGDPIQAVIRGIGVSSDGRGKSLWAPRREGQILAIERAYSGGLEPSRLQYVEAHATSTQVGDATEMNALAQSIATHIPAGTRIPIASVKANIGHTLEAAGAASLIKTILAMQHGVIPGQIHLDRLNPDIDWDRAPFFVPRQNTPWDAPDDGHPRRAAVNAFGIGGLNAHVVLDEYRPASAVAVSFARSERPTPGGEDVTLPAGYAPAGPSRSSLEPIAIVGASCRFAGTTSLEDYGKLLASGGDATCPPPGDRWNLNALCGLLPDEQLSPLTGSLKGGFITDFQYDWRLHKIPPVQVARANPLQFMVLAAVHDALTAAGWNLAECDRTRVGVIVGTQFGSDFANELQMGMRLPEFQRDLGNELARRGVPAETIERICTRYAEVLLSHMPALLDESGSFSTSTLASRVAKTYDLMGGAVAVDAGEAASLAAIALAIDNLREGQVDRVVCAAAQRMMDPVFYQQLVLAGRVPGIVPGEGVGVLLLKRLSDAERDGDRVLGLLRDVGSGFAQTQTDATHLAIRHVLEFAPPTNGELAGVETAKVGCLNEDNSLLAALTKELSTAGIQQPAIHAEQSPVGHLLGASGMASLLKFLSVGRVTRSVEATAENGSGDRSCGTVLIHAADRWGGSMALLVESANAPQEPAAAAQFEGNENNRQKSAAESRVPTAKDGVVTLPALPIVRLSGTPYEIGLQHGRDCADAIRRVVHAYADTVGQPWDRLPDIDQAAQEPELYFGPDELDEMAGMAAGAGISREAIIAHNLRLYPDMGSGCVHFAVRTRDGLLHGANEDRPAGLMIRGVLQRTIQQRRPRGGIPYIAFGVAGEVGGINGLNASGLIVTSAMLLDLPRRGATRRGLLHVVLVNRLLREGSSLDEALRILRAHHGTSSWGVLLSHASSGDVLYAEYDGGQLRTQHVEGSFVAANHALLLEPVADTPAHSKHRLERLRQLVRDDGLTLPAAQAALRDRFDIARGRETRHPTMNTIRRVDNQISVVFQPAAGQAFVTPGPTGDEREDIYQRLDIASLLAPDEEATPAAGAAKPALRTLSHESPQETATVCSRFVLRTAAAARTPCQPRPLPGTTIILGSGPLASALAEQVVHRGGQPVVVNASQPRDALLAAVDGSTTSTGPVHLVLATPHDADACGTTNLEQWPHRRQHGIVTPYLVCQRWYSRLHGDSRLSQSHLVAVTALGGQLGFDRHDHSPESGALGGLVKAVWFETGMNGPGMAAKVIDLDPAESPTVLAGYVLEEIDRGQPDVEVGYASQRRYLVRPQQQAVPPPVLQPDRGGVWVVTGGGRGVTAIVARELGRRFGLKLHLLGTSPSPQVNPAWRDLSPDQLRNLKAQVTRDALAHKQVPAQVWQQIERALEIDRNLRRMAAAGAEATYHQCDVANRATLASTLEAIRKTSGPIAGIVHGAGVELSCRFEKKQLDMLERTLAAKVDGAVNLIELTQNDPLRYFIAFGSISGRFGNFGQTDYSLANETLSKLVTWLRTTRPGIRAATFQWHSWAEVGMAVRPESKHAKKLKNMQFMPTLEGAGHLIDELCAGLPESEVLITDPNYFRSFYP